jgi:hypothetical protein
MISFGQLLLTVSIPTLVALIGVIFNQISNSKLADKVDRHQENFNNQVTTLLTTIHGVDVRVARLEEHK